LFLSIGSSLKLRLSNELLFLWRKRLFESFCLLFADSTITYKEDVAAFHFKEDVASFNFNCDHWSVEVV